MRKIMLVFLAISISVSCQKKKIINSINEDMIDLELIKKHLKLQEKIELHENDNEGSHLYKLTETDIELGGEIIRKGLINNGYKLIPQEEFLKKVNNVFRIHGNTKNENIVYHENFFTYLIPSDDGQQGILKQTEYDYTYEHLFFFNKVGFVTSIPLLGDIIKIKADDSYQIELPQSLISRNKYLFNNSKADLAWMLFNDKEFLKSLLINFNYDKEAEITKMVLKEFNFNDTNLFHHLIFDTVNNKYKIRENILNDIESIIYHGKTQELLSPAKEGNGYDSLTEILEEIYLNPTDYIESNKTIAFLMEKALDVGNIGIPQSFLHAHEEFIHELEKNNYYNYERLKSFSDNLNLFGRNENEILDKKSIKISNSYILRLFDRPDFSSFSREIMVKGDIEILHNISGWDFIKADGTTGYLPTSDVKKEKPNRSFLADEAAFPQERKGFWKNIFG